MAEESQAAPGRGVNAELVGMWAEAAGLRLAPERLPLVAEALRELQDMTAAFDELQLDDVAPELGFDARWADEG
jgi:hypothetical protein